MPLGTGSWWEYRAVVLETVGGLVLEDYEDTRYAEVTFAGESELHGGMAWLTKVMDDVHTAYGYYMAVSDGALTAYQDLESPSGEIYLREPLEAGTTWVTHARQDPGIEISGEILSVSEDLEMPLWSFEDCIHVRTAFRRDVMEEYPGSESVTWEHWYARGVGIVRSVIVTENAPWLYRRVVTQELLNYSVR